MKLSIVLLVLVHPIATALGGPFVLYDGKTFPEEVGWARSPRLFPPDRTIEDGWLVQRAEIIPDPPNLDAEEDDFYRRSIAEFAGTETFFLEWRMETDGPRGGFPAVSPAVIVAGGQFGISYHFTIADDQVRFIRDNLLPLVFVHIEPGIPHTYRLELFGAESYSFLIDGHVVDSGVPEGAYPTRDSDVIVFGGRAAIPDGVTTVRWDYVTYGAIPEPATACLLLLGTALLTLRRRKSDRVSKPA